MGGDVASNVSTGLFVGAQRQYFVFSPVQVLTDR